MDRQKSTALCIGLTALGCAAMFLVERGPAPAYPVKSGLKLLFFLSCILFYVLVVRDKRPFLSLRLPRPGALRLPVLLAAGGFVFLLGGCALLSPWLDLSAIPGALAAKEGFTRKSFPLAAVYITFVNSLLEEFFFRGFTFLTLREAGMKRLAWWISSLSFALYHVAIMDGWFHPALLVLLTAGLVISGLFFNWLDRCGSLWPGWVVHMGANLAINTIALHLWGII